MKSIPIDCAKCKLETTHNIRLDEHTSSAVTILATCSICGNTIRHEGRGAPRYGSLADKLGTVIDVGERRRKIRKG